MEMIGLPKVFRNGIKTLIVLAAMMDSYFSVGALSSGYFQLGKDCRNGDAAVPYPSVFDSSVAREMNAVKLIWRTNCTMLAPIIDYQLEFRKMSHPSTDWILLNIPSSLGQDSAVPKHASIDIDKKEFSSSRSKSPECGPLVDVRTFTQHYTLRGLDQDSQYEVRVRGRNFRGVGNFSPVLVIGSELKPVAYPTDEADTTAKYEDNHATSFLSGVDSVTEVQQINRQHYESSGLDQATRRRSSKMPLKNAQAGVASNVATCSEGSEGLLIFLAFTLVSFAAHLATS